MATVIENRGPELLAVNFGFLFVTVVIVITRVAVRCFMLKRFWIDDWMMVFASFFFIAYCSCSIRGVYHGTGRHMSDLSEEGYAHAKQLWFYCYLTYCWTMILSKASIGLFLLRVAVRRAHIWIIYATMGITILTCLIFFLLTVLQCHPISYFWDRYTQSGTCINNDVIIGLAYLYSTCSIITDATFALLPAWIISQLEMKRRTKIALVPLMGMGVIASSAVVVRLAFLYRLADPDFLWATTDIAIFSTVEQGLAISAGSLATLRPLFKLCGYKLGLTSEPRSYQPGAYGNSAHPSSHAETLGRRGSQGAADALKLEKQCLRSPKTLDKYGLPCKYEVRCEAGFKDRIVHGPHLSGGISQGRTYEVSSEYMDRWSTSGGTMTTRVTIPIKSPEATWQVRLESDTESTDVSEVRSSRDEECGR